MLLSAEHIFKNYGIKQLLSDACLYLNERDRIGIVGVNGTGKSTLLKILAGLESADEGVVSSNPNLQVVYLPQNPVLNEDFTALEQVLHDFSSGLNGAGSYEAKSMLTKLGVDFNMKISALSGGQKKRVALAEALIHPSDVLILDEPTNHLDSELVCWLEQYLTQITAGLIMVTHDRYFLERVVNRIVELSNTKLYAYEANYSKYLELKSMRGEMDKSSERKRQTLLKHEYEWIMRGARARSTKSRGRIESYEKLRNQEPPQENERIKLATVSSRLGKKIIELKNISKAYEQKTVVKDFSYMISRDDRVGIVGKNGAGKSTLLNIIAGHISPDSGVVDLGVTVKIGYFTQECKELDYTQRIYDFITEVSSEIKTDEGIFSASEMLERFLFTSDMQYSTIGRLSGGERRRLYLLSILMSGPNVLLLDEPTNDLDIETLAILEDYLNSFPGAVIAVSHDRYFLDKMSTSIFEVGENGIITGYNGNYSDYMEKRENVNCKKKNAAHIESRQSKQSKDEQEQKKTKKLKFSFNEQRDFEKIDEIIASIETQIFECTKEIEHSADDYVRLQALLEEKEQLEIDLEAKTERWVYLNELAEKIKNNTL